MDNANWTDVVTAAVALLALVISIWTYLVTRTHSLLERVHKLTDRLYEIDRVLLELPELQCFLYQQAQCRQPFFTQEVEHDDMYFRVKTFVYLHLNFYDELISIVEGNKPLEKAIEFKDWKEYIIRKMRHPLFRELFDRESPIWGKKFRAFIEANRPRIMEPLEDRDMF